MSSTIDTLKGRIKPLVPISAYRLLGYAHELRRSLIEQEHFQAFQRFYERLENKKNILYMFFSSGLIHWAIKALRFVPPDVNIVLIGSDLNEEEINWINANIKRPFHHILLRVDDKTVLEFLFKANRHHFGWMHIDCFVLNPALFSEIVDIQPDVSINGIWANSGPHDIKTVHVPLVFVNADVIKALRERGIAVSPCTYNYEGSLDGRWGIQRHAYSKVPSSQQIALLKQIMPVDVRGLPQYPDGYSFFDIGVLYQLVTNALGYELHMIRNLTRKADRHFSEEVIHVGNSCIYKIHSTSTKPLNQYYYRMELMFDYLLLKEASYLPKQYAQFRRQAIGEFKRLGIAQSQVKLELGAFLAQRGVYASAIERIFPDE